MVVICEETNEESTFTDFVNEIEEIKINKNNKTSKTNERSIPIATDLITVNETNKTNEICKTIKNIGAFNVLSKYILQKK